MSDGSVASGMTPPTVDGDRFVSYAQNGEDVILWRALSKINNGRYVDVGAADPIVDSVTLPFYLRGWRGIHIEPVSSYAAALRTARPEDTVVGCVAGAEEGEITFFEFPETGLSTTQEVEADRAKELGFAETRRTVAMRTLDSILSDVISPEDPIHFLKVDVEGFEPSVLQGANLQKWRPWVVVVEATRPNSSERTDHTFGHHLTDAGYTATLFDGLNMYYVSAEHPEFADRLSYPACALDDYVRIKQVVDAERIDDIHAALEQETWNRIELEWQVQASIAERVASRAELTRIKQKAARSNARLRRQRKNLRDPKYLVNRAAKGSISRIKRASPKAKLQVGSQSQHGIDAQTGNITPWQVAEGFSQLRPTLSELQARDCRESLASHDLDNEEQLAVRLDGANDVAGLLLAECQAMVALHDLPPEPPAGTGRGDRILIDARSVQDPNYSRRGIGRYTRAVIKAISLVTTPDRLIFLTSIRLPDLEPEIARVGTVWTHVPKDLSSIGLFVQPSPLTAPIAPLVPIFSESLPKIAIVYDFIPAQFPERYLSSESARVLYTAGLSSLPHYDQLISISHCTMDAAAEVDVDLSKATVAWPEALRINSPELCTPKSGDDETLIVLFSGGDDRKNHVTGLEACAILSRRMPGRVKVALIGHSYDPAGAIRDAAKAGFNRHDLLIVSAIDDETLEKYVSNSDLVLVPSRSEGLSLPVIEAIGLGVPVVVSDIEAHRELLGTGDFFGDPDNALSLTSALECVLKNREAVFADQVAAIGSHDHRDLESVLLAACQKAEDQSEQSPASPVKPVLWLRGTKPALGVITPWPPQHSGVADYSEFTLPALREYCDLTIYAAPETSSSAMSSQRPQLSTSMVREHDAFLSVLGNSHFHLPMLRVLEDAGGAALAHDTRMIDFYAHLRGTGGAASLMNKNGRNFVSDGDVSTLHMNIDELGDTCYWEIAHAAQPLIFHSRIATERTAVETGTSPRRICFVPYKLPTTTEPAARIASRERLGLKDSELNLVCVGIVDTGTKKADLIIEAVGWLNQWGFPTRVHFVGPVAPPIRTSLIERASDAGIGDRLNLTGRVERETYCDYLLGGDLGLQIRSNDLLGISGALVDCAAFGMPALASEPLVYDMDTPSFVEALPVVISPLILAEEILAWLDRRPEESRVEDERRAYVADFSVSRYAHELAQAIGLIDG